jgi:hypothetical protein
MPSEYDVYFLEKLVPQGYLLFIVAIQLLEKLARTGSLRISSTNYFVSDI